MSHYHLLSDFNYTYFELFSTTGRGEYAHNNSKISLIGTFLNCSLLLKLFTIVVALLQLVNIVFRGVCQLKEAAE